MPSKTILIVDDEPRTRLGFTKTLENWANGQFRIMGAASGEEAIKALRQWTVHLLITDIRMPEMSGLKMVKALNEIGGEHVVIVVSAFPEFEYAQEALRLGVVNYLLKPVSKHKLIEAVEQALKVKEKQIRTGFIEKVVDNKLASVHVEDSYTPTSIKDAMRYVDNHYDQDITLKHVAKQIHLNASYFSALFKEQTELTFSEYVTRIRLQHAKRLLISTDLPIAEVAEKIGYKTAKYFIKLFKQYEGITPSAYRRHTNATD